MNSNFENQLMKDLCAHSLRTALKKLKRASRDELSGLSGITIPMLDELTTELCLTGEFIRDETSKEPSGAEEVFYRYNAGHKLILAICIIGKDRVYIAVSDLYGEYIAREAISTSPYHLDFFEEIIERYRKEYPAISLLAFALAGFEVKGQEDKLLTVDYPDFEWVHFRSHFKDKYGLDSILINEIKAAVSGYCENRRFGEGSCVAAIYVSRFHHPGAGICIDGKLYRGRDNAAGEVIFLKTDVQWKHFEKNEINPSELDIEKLIADIALPYAACLNPDCLVIYCRYISPEIQAGVKNRLMENIPREFLPELVFVADIMPDCLDGLTHLALKKLEPGIELEEGE
jgi:hypothetical protein